MHLDIHLYATLREYAPVDAVGGAFSFQMPDEATVGTLLQALGIPSGKVHMRIVNGVGVAEEYRIRENDRIGLFPPVGGG